MTAQARVLRLPLLLSPARAPEQQMAWAAVLLQAVRRAAGSKVLVPELRQALPRASTQVRALASQPGLASAQTTASARVPVPAPALALSLCL